MSLLPQYICRSSGKPVVCHRRDNPTHLNRKIGDLRSQDKDTGRYEVVHFEDKDLKPCLVKHENIRILLELPDE